jgi:RNA polymerase sigma factor (sigma-70 family)
VFSHPCAQSVTAEDRQAFLTAIVRDHGPGLRQYLAARLRNAAADVPDLVQEVYLRLLRMPRHEVIRSPQAYVFTIAHNVLYEHGLRRSNRPETVGLTDMLSEMPSPHAEDPAAQADSRQRLEQLDRSLQELSPRAYATFVLHRRYGFSLDEIAQHFGVSRPMVKKYLAKAVVHCRERFEGVK